MSKQKIQIITVNQAGPPANIGFFTAFILFILIVMFWKWLLLGAGIVALIWLGYWVDASQQRREAELDAVRHRADTQDRWVHEGDPRGTYGE